MEVLAANGFDYILDANNINFMAVIVAAVFSFVIGGIWYHEGTLGARWQKLVGLKKKDIEKANMPQIFGTAFVLTLIQALFMSSIMSGLNVRTAFEGLLFGAVIGSAFAATSLGVQYLYAQRKLELFAIDAGYVLLQFAIMGLILGWWQ